MHLQERHNNNFERKAWYQSDGSSGVWVLTCPQEYWRLNAGQFPVVAHTYFGVSHECLRGLEGLDIQLKSGGGREDTIITCDPLLRKHGQGDLTGSRLDTWGIGGMLVTMPLCGWHMRRMYLHGIPSHKDGGIVGEML